MPLNEPDPAMAGLEAALAALVPMPGRINRDVLLFRAGQASVRGRRWLWPGAAAVLGLVAATLGVLVLVRPAPQPVERVIVVRVREPAPPESVPAPPAAKPEPALPVTVAATREPMNYAQLEKQILRWGLDGVPAPPPPAAPSEPPLTRDYLLGASPPSSPFEALFRPGSFFQ
jgi:hypothetical protein